MKDRTLEIIGILVLSGVMVTLGIYVLLTKTTVADPISGFWILPLIIPFGIYCYFYIKKVKKKSDSKREFIKIFFTLDDDDKI